MGKKEKIGDLCNIAPSAMPKATFHIALHPRYRRTGKPSCNREKPGAC